MRILITGICGFAGSAMAQHWMEHTPGLSVYGIDNFSRPGSETNRSRMRRLGVKLFHGDVRMPSDIEPLPPVDWVIDAAASPSVLSGIDSKTSSRQLVEHNLLGTINMLEYCKRHHAGFVLLSSSRVYSIAPLVQLPMEVAGNAYRPVAGPHLPPGISPSGLTESFSTAAPISLYGSSKLASEVMALEYGETFGFPVLVNRCGILAGGGQFGTGDQGVFSFWINAWLRRRPLAYHGFDGSGRQVRDCLHPRDLVSLLIRQTSAGAGVPSHVFNVAGGIDNSISLAGLSEWCTNRIGSHPVGGVAGERRFDVPWLVLDPSHAREVWGWQPETGLVDILEEIVRHAEQHPEWLELSEQS